MCFDHDYIVFKKNNVHLVYKDVILSYTDTECPSFR